MSKRSLGDAVEEVGASKRQKPSSIVFSRKLVLLREYYKELRAFVKAAEHGGSAEDDASLGRLAALNETTLPILQALSEKDFPGSHDKGDKAAQEIDSGEIIPASTFAPETRPLMPISLIPSLANMTVWTIQDIPSVFPPLPPIPDEKLERMALTHRGKNEGANYETLEFLGDSFIYHAASEFITQTFPELTPGRKSQMREGLLRNSNLARYTIHYGIEKRANFPPEFTDGVNIGGTKVTAKERQKVHGDLFEAYVGALTRARPPAGQLEGYDGVTVTLRWLKSLWAMSLAQEIERKYGMRRNKQQPPEAPEHELQLPMKLVIGNAVAGSAGSSTTTSTTADTNTAGTTGTVAADTVAANGNADQKDTKQQRTLTSKVQLAALIGCKEAKIRYEDAPTKKVLRDKHSGMPLFTVAVWVDAWGTSECLGYGSALSKKGAGDKAAARALENKAKMKYYVAQKAKFYGDKDQAQLNTALQEDTRA